MKKEINSARVLVAMSGGVDSSVAAQILINAGYSCTGATMKLFYTDDVCTVSREKSCCSLEDVEDAKSVSAKLGMPHHVFNFSSRFAEDVLDKFVGAYENGRTPNPCIDCNRFLKFDKLYLRAREMGIEYVATGHYAKTAFDGNSGRWLLKKAADATKDQSYVLYSLTQEQLSKTLFPLGGLLKTEVREIAQGMGFINAKKKDSQDICFVQEGRYTDFIEKYTGKVYPEGDFIDTEGKTLGRHKGIIHYTVGQRKGLGISFAEPMFVTAINPRDNTVTLGSENQLFSDTFYIDDVNFISVPELREPTRFKAKVRYSQSEKWATAERADTDRVKIVFDEPQRAITPGQAAVLYDGDTVALGGTICG